MKTEMETCVFCQVQTPVSAKCSGCYAGPNARHSRVDRLLLEPLPPKAMLRRADHHWLKRMDSDGNYHGTVVLQWSPGARRWSHSGDVGTGYYVDTANWQYEGLCPMLVSHDTDGKLPLDALRKHDLYVAPSGLIRALRNGTNYYEIKVQMVAGNYHNDADKEALATHLVSLIKGT